MAAFNISTFIDNPTLRVRVSLFDKCKKSDLRLIAEHYGIFVPSALAKAELKAVILDGLISRGILSLLASVEASSLGGGAVAASSPGEGPSDSPVKEASELPLCTHLPVRREGAEVKPLALPQFEPLSIESSPGCWADARLRVCLACLQIEKEEREREFQFRKELEFKKLEAETAIKMHQLEIQASSVHAAVTVQPPSSSVAAFDISKNISLVPAFHEAEVECYFGAFERD